MFVSSQRSADATASFRFGRLLLIVVVAFMLSAVDDRWANAVTAFLVVALVLVAFRTTSLRTSSPKLALLTVVAVAAAVMTTFTDRTSSAMAVSAFAQAALITILLALVLRAVLRSFEVDTQTIIGAVTAYTMIGMAFAALYVGIDIVDDGQLSIPNSDRSQYAPFSFVVLTTLGFGDQTPTAPFAARVVVLQAVTGQVFLPVFIARLVSLYRRPGSDGSSTDDENAPSGEPGAS